MTGEAARHLDRARARVRELSAAIHAAHGSGDWNGLRAAQLDVLAAEREVARIAGDEYAEELDFELRWDTGAPLPHVVANGHRTFLLFYLPNRDPDWDGTWVRVVDPAAPQPQPLGVVEFHRVHAVTLGGPNDEALDGHPLSEKGLRAYAAHRWSTRAGSPTPNGSTRCTRSTAAAGTDGSTTTCSASTTRHSNVSPKASPPSGTSRRLGRC